jgi:CubicO group peptidase (beta-lactamase class C family)
VKPARCPEAGAAADPVRRSAYGILVLLAASAAGQAQPAPNPSAPAMNVTAAIAPICARAKLPAMAAAIVTSEGLAASGVVGVRKAGTEVAATLQDDWHLGSDTKAMTATLIGLLVDAGSLKFESTLAEVFPDLAASFPETVRGITVEQLLAHRAGLPPNASWSALSAHGSLTDQRLEAVRVLGGTDLAASPGTSFHYSNWGYVVLGAIAERITGQSWEDLMRERVFKPLKMDPVGFGGTGTLGKIDQPWPHVNGEPRGSNGPLMDNPAVMAPAGGMHCPIGEWAKFIANELKGLRGQRSLLSKATFDRLHAPAFGENYAGGWICVPRGWAEGIAYNHGGSNTMNYALAWLAPNRDVAFLVCANDGNAAKPCDAAIGALLKLYASRTH